MEDAMQMNIGPVLWVWILGLPLALGVIEAVRANKQSRGLPRSRARRAHEPHAVLT